MKNVLEYLENSAAISPDKAAVRDPENCYSYSELIRRAQAVGSGLLREEENDETSQSAYRGRAGRSTVVFMEKSVQALASFLGIVYAGRFYTYISPEQPAARIRQILEVLRPDTVITDSEARAGDKLTEAGFSGRVLDYDMLCQKGISSEALAEVRARAADTDPLYCNFTSGSTGVPKGVLVSHRSVIDFIGVFPNLFEITRDDVIGNQAPFDFDVSVKDIYSSLRMGATLVLIPKRYFSLPAQLIDYLCEQEVTTLIWAVSALCMVTQLKGFTYRVPEKINKVLFSGEAMPVKHLNLWRKYLPDAQYVNLYGPTEITCNCTYYRVNREFGPEEKIPAGRPFPNEKVFLLRVVPEGDETEEITAPNMTGEICVAGTALALGYYRNPQQTAKVFVQNPLNSDYPETIYRTGDLGFYDDEGNLCFAGRLDFQIKHMGHRIELEEIELILNGYEEIGRAVCIFDEEKDRLIACYAGDIDGKTIRSKMQKTVPMHMIPQVFRQLAQLPMTANGKIDRKELRARFIK